jgi:hypothetical protein
MALVPLVEALLLASELGPNVIITIAVGAGEPGSSLRSIGQERRVGEAGVEHGAVKVEVLKVPGWKSRIHGSESRVKSDKILSYFNSDRTTLA